MEISFFWFSLVRSLLSPTAIFRLVEEIHTFRSFRQLNVSRYEHEREKSEIITLTFYLFQLLQQ